MFGYLAANAAGIWVLIVIVFSGILAAQWLSWIFRWGRFSQETSKEKSIRFILVELAANIINEFRHLLALALVLLFGGVLAFGLARAGKDAQGISAVLQAVASSLGGLIGAIIGYYFGESAGNRRRADEPTATRDVNQREDVGDGIREPDIQPPVASDGDRT
jgi:hypothetical protein